MGILQTHVHASFQAMDLGGGKKREKFPFIHSSLSPSVIASTSTNFHFCVSYFSHLLWDPKASRPPFCSLLSGPISLYAMAGSSAMETETGTAPQNNQPEIPEPGNDMTKTLHWISMDPRAIDGAFKVCRPRSLQLVAFFQRASLRFHGCKCGFYHDNFTKKKF